MSEILNELGVFVITIGISIAIFIGIHLKTKPAPSEDANAAFQAACAISPEAKVEFEKVYDLLGQKISPSEILQKIKRKFG